MKPSTYLRDERGIALVVVLFMALIVGAISAGATLVSSNARLINRYTDAQSALQAAADAGLEETRSKINGNPALYPDSLYSTLENGAAVYDADGQIVPGLKRWIYVGPSGVTTGQYGVFGSVVSVVEDQAGNRVVRREEIVQESFAKYAYFTDVEPSYIAFGGGDQITGPVHTNDYLKIYSSGATFLGPVETAKTVQGGQYGTFAQGYTENAPYIPMPNTADLNKLRAQAQAGGTYVLGNSNGSTGDATTRIEFVAIDIDGDGQTNGPDEGFMMVYQSTNADYVTADRPSSNSLSGSRNCGAVLSGTFQTAQSLGGSYMTAVTAPNARCYLGGASELFGGFQPTDGQGAWLVYTTSPDPAVAAAAPARANYLYPITRRFNPAFKGVVFVDGKVVISGQLRGQVTLAATDDIIIGDDITYVTNPGAGTCNDVLGIFSGDDVIIADNTINAPARPKSGWNHRTYDDTKDEFIHGVVLALDIFTVENYSSGSTNDEWCETRVWGRGCLYLTGGIIQRTRGAVGTGAGTGSLKRYSYDQCAFSTPPPYFPTTGHFARGRYYEVDPNGFNVSAYWSFLTP